MLPSPLSTQRPRALPQPVRSWRAALHGGCLLTAFKTHHLLPLFSPIWACWWESPSQKLCPCSSGPVKSFAPCSSGFSGHFQTCLGAFSDLPSKVMLSSKPFQTFTYVCVWVSTSQPSFGRCDGSMSLLQGEDKNLLTFHIPHLGSAHLLPQCCWCFC